MPFVPCCNCRRSSSPPLPRIRVTKAPPGINGSSATLPRAPSHISYQNSISSEDRRALNELFGQHGPTDRLARQSGSGSSTPRLAQQVTPQADAQHRLSPRRVSDFTNQVKGQISRKSGLSRASWHGTEPNPRTSSLHPPEHKRHTKGPAHVDSWAVRRSESGGYDSDAVVLNLPE